MLSFDYLKPPAVVVSADPHEGKPIELRRTAMKRKLLSEIQKNCHTCRRPLQSDDREADDYGRHVDGWLHCGPCEPIAREAYLTERRRVRDEREALLTPSQRAACEAKRREIERFKMAERFRKLRQKLWEFDPHCDNCGRLVQISQLKNRLTYAHVAEQAGRLACGHCVKIVLRLWHAEHDSACFLDEWRAEQTTESRGVA